MHACIHTGARAAAMEREKEQINAQYLELWKKHYSTPDLAQETTATNPATVARLADLEASVINKEAQVLVL